MLFTVLQIPVEIETPLLDWVQLGLSAATLIFFGVILWYTRQSSMAANQSAKAAATSAEAAEESNERAVEEMRIRLRPWLYIGYPVLDRIENADGSTFARVVAGNMELTTGAPDDAVAILRIPITNHGQFPATNIDTLVVFDLNEPAALNGLNRITNLKRSINPPSHTHQQTAHVPVRHFLPMRRGEITGYLMVRVHYDDRDGIS